MADTDEFGIPTKPTVAPAIKERKAETGTTETSVGYVARKFGGAFGEGVGSGVEAGIGLGYGEALPIAALRWFLPPEWVDKLAPISPATPAVSKVLEKQGATRPRAAGAAVGRNVAGTVAGGSREDEMGRPPGPVSESFGNMAEFMGAAYSRPAPGMWTGRGLATTTGAALGSEAAGESVENIIRRGGAPEEDVQSAGAKARIAGAMATAPLNVARLNVLAEPFGKLKQAARAVGQAWNKREEAGGFKNALDQQFSGLREQSTSTLQRIVNEQVARDISLDPDAPDAYKAFVESVNKTGANEAKFNIASQVSTPSLVGTIEQYKPKTPQDVQRVASANAEAEKEVRRVYKSLEGRAAVSDADSIAKGIREIQKGERIRLSGLATEADNTAAGVRVLSPSERQEAGASLRTFRDTEEARVKQQVTGPMYDQALALDNNQVYDVSLATRNALNKLGYEVPKPENLTLREMRDLQTKISKDIKSLERNPEKQVEVRERTVLSRDLADTISDHAEPAALRALETADDWYKKNFVPRFRQGANVNLTRAATTARAGEELVTDAAVVKSYLKPTASTGQISEESMQQFDNLFGGGMPGAVRNDTAYQQLGREIEDAYRNKVLQGYDVEKGFDPNNHTKFLRDWEAALERSPETAKKLNDTAEKLTNFQAEAQRVKDNYKAILESPFTKKGVLDNEHIEKVLTTAMANPRKMGKLISSMSEVLGGERAGANAIIKDVFERARPWRELEGGGFEMDGTKLLKVLNDGAQGGSVPSLKVAFRAAFGRALGDEHYDNLRKIAVLEERRALTDPKMLRPTEPFPPDLMRGVTGSTAGSTISDIKSIQQGRVGKAYAVTNWIARFGNMKLREGYERATKEALFNPEMSKAILTMAEEMRRNNHTASPELQRAASTIGRVMGSASADWFKRLADYGMIRENMAKGGAIAGIVEANKSEKEKRKDRRPAFDEFPYIQ